MLSLWLLVCLILFDWFIFSGKKDPGRSLQTTSISQRAELQDRAQRCPALKRESRMVFPKGLDLITMILEDSVESERIDYKIECSFLVSGVVWFSKIHLDEPRP